MSETIQALSPHVIISVAEKKSSKAASTGKDDPSVILLFGWMDGSRYHIEKYRTIYREMFPASTIVIVRVDSSFYWSTEKTKESLLEPVLPILKREAEDSSQWNGAILHVMSNGGGWQLMTLRKMLLKNPTILPNPHPAVLVLDSTPGDNGLDSAIRANAPANFFLRSLSIPYIVIAYALFTLISKLSGQRPLFEELRAMLLEKEVLPSSVTGSQARSTPRLYIYSNRDKMTRYKNVERHIEQAKAAGLDVKVEKFENSPHVAHARSDPKRYWDAVRALWNAAD